MTETIETIVIIENDRHRRRLDSTPIINGLGIDQPKDREINLLEVEQPRERKRSRTEDDVEREKMMIIKDVSDENLCTVETVSISGLIENVEEEKVRLLIECFNPIIRSSPDHIKQTMLECSDKWENKKNIYIGAINYIVHGRKEESSRDEQLKERSLEELCEILTREIENRMPKPCGKCKEVYIVRLMDKPVIHCMWCKVGMHDCTETKGIENCNGIKWLCVACEPIFNKHFLPKLDKAAFFEGFEIEKVINKVNKSVEPEAKKSTVVPERRKQAEKNKDNQEKDKNEEPVVTIQPEENIVMEVIESVIEENERNKGNNRNKERNDVPEPRKEICWFWKNKKCRFTTSCKHDHPEKCKEMIETGRCKDNRCKLIHPKICRNLFYKGYCHRGESCWFTHPSKCENSQPKHSMDHSYTGNQSMENRRNQNISNQNVSPNFLGNWPTINNNQNYRISQNPSMTQMMQNMMDKLTQMDSKISYLERGRQMFY